MQYSSIAEKRMSIRAHLEEPDPSSKLCFGWVPRTLVLRTSKKYKSVYIYILIHITIEILTFLRPCYIIRRVKRRGKMPKRIKILLSILCIILVAMSLLSFFVAATSAFHICKRSACPICRFMDMVSDLQRSLHHSNAAVLIILWVLVSIRLTNIAMTMAKVKTPVDLMVRMND